MRIVISVGLTLLGIPMFSGAQNLVLGPAEGIPIAFRPDEQYLEIKLTNFQAPKAEDASFWERVFLKRKSYGIGYVIVAGEGSDPIKTMIFEYDKNGERQYTYKALGVSQDFSYTLAGPLILPHEKKIKIQLVIKNWEDERSYSIVRQIVSATQMAGYSAGTIALSNTAINLIEGLWPPKSADDVLTMQIGAADFNKDYVPIIMTDQQSREQRELVRIRFVPSAGILSDFNLPRALESPRLRDIDGWRELVAKADDDSGQSGFRPLVNTLSTLCNQVRKLPLVHRDKVLLLAGIIHNWAPNAVNGVQLQGRDIRFGAADFTQIPLGDLQFVRDTKWDFPGGNCRTKECTILADFIGKSTSPSGRERATKYFRGNFAFARDGKDEEISSEDYIKEFAITKVSSFDKNGYDEVSATFKFPKGKLGIRYKGQLFSSDEALVTLIRDENEWAIQRIQLD